MKHEQLTKEQQNALFEIMRVGTLDTIRKVLDFAATSDENYEPSEVKEFIRCNYAVVAKLSNKIISHVAATIVAESISDEVNLDPYTTLDFPNSDKESENNKSSNKNNER